MFLVLRNEPMKKLCILLLSIILIIFNSCKNDPFLDSGNSEPINNLNVNSDFDWRTSEEVLINISAMPRGVVKITSRDGSILYNKGFNTVAGLYSVIINVPTYITHIAVNSQLVELNSNEVNYNFLGGIGPGLKDGGANHSMKFDDKKGIISVEDDNSLDLTTAGTLEAWINIKSNDAFNKYGGIIHKGDNKNFSDEAYSLHLRPDKKLRLLITNGSTDKYVESDQSLNKNEWYHIAATWDENSMKMYINGGLSNEEGSSLIVRNTSGGLNIGAQLTKDYSKSLGRLPFKGYMDEVRVWNIARTQNEILNSMGSLNGDETGLSGYWKFNTGTGNTVYDATSNKNDGEITKAKWDNKVDYIVDTDGDGVVDSEDDYPEDEDMAFNNYYPATGYGTLAFEDLWPGKGDYDFNDLITDYKFTTITNSSNKIVNITGEFIVRAFGAGLHNGFGFQLANDNVSGSDISVTGYNIQENYITLNANGTESGQDKPTIIVFDDTFNVLQNPGSGTGVNTTPGSDYVEPETLNIVMTFKAGTYTSNDINISAFNPFLIIGQTRGKEIHLPDYVPTSLVDNSFFGTANDNSIPAEGRYYKTSTNLPWAINIYESFDYPNEKIDIGLTHLKFTEWALSNGASYEDWYKDLTAYRNDDNIYEIE